ncbi:MAG TPA: hypothetical protein VD772_05380, partial [Anseongella sp.]|nr:hypothetical protein [Anseongella sp.]
ENPDTAGTKLPFIIPQLRIRNARIVTVNHYKQTSFSLLVREADLQANLSGRRLQLEGKLSGRVDSVTGKQLVLFRREPFSAILQYAYNLKQKQGRFANTSLVLNRHQIRITGGHRTLPQGKGANLDLKLSGNQPLFYLLTQLLPAQAKAFLSQVTTKSKMQFSLHLTGESGPTARPRSLLKFALRNGNVYLPGTKTAIRQVTLLGEMDNGARQQPESSRLTISEFSANTREDSFRVALKVTNFRQPVFQFLGQGRMRLDKLAAFVKLPVNRITAGALVGKISLSGSLPAPRLPQTPDWHGRGFLVLQEAAFRPVGLTQDCRGVNGSIRFRDNLLDMEGLQGTLGGQPFKLQASIRNFQAYLFDQPGAIR